MKRREFVEKLGIGSAGLVAATSLGTAAVSAAGPQHVHGVMDGPLAHATVSFGQWRTDPVIDRFPANNPRTQNNHAMMPYTPTIKAGGSVGLLISGLHLILVYAPGKTMADVDLSVIDFANPGVFPGFINDPDRRIYRGPDPRPLPQDRVEVVTFAQPGKYLVVCGVLTHFLDNMHGFVNVLP